MKHWGLIILLAACGGGSHPPPGDDGGTDGDADADTDADSDTDSDADADADSDPPVEGQPGEDLPGAWTLDPDSGDVVVEGELQDTSCCHCPATALSLVAHEGEVVLASSDMGEAFQVVGMSPLGDVVHDAVSVPGHPEDTDHADQLLVSTGDGYAAIFVDERNGEREAYLRRIGLDLSLGDEFQLTTRQTPVQLAVGAREDGELGVAFGEGDNLFALRADADAGTISESERQLTTLESVVEARATGAGSRWGVAFSDYREGQEDVFFSLVGDGGEPTTDEGLKIAGTDPASTNPFVAWTGTEFAVAWEERLADGSETASTWFARVDADGVPVEGSARVVLPYEGEDGPGASATGYHWPRALLWTGAELVLVAVRGEDRGTTRHRTEVVVFRLDADGGADPDGPVVLASGVHDDHDGSGPLYRTPLGAVLGPGELAIAWNVFDSAGLANCEGDVSAIRLARLVLEN